MLAFFDEVLDQLESHHQLADLGAGQGELPLLGIAPALQPAGAVRNTRFQLSSSCAGI